MNGDRAGRVRALVLACWALLALTLSAWYASLLAPAAAALAGLLTIAPLALPLPGLLARRRRTYRWSPFTLAPALGWSLTELVANPAARPFAIAAGCLAFLGLAAVVAWLRVSPPAQPS